MGLENSKPQCYPTRYEQGKDMVKITKSNTFYIINQFLHNKVHRYIVQQVAAQLPVTPIYWQF